MPVTRRSSKKRSSNDLTETLESYSVNTIDISEQKREIMATPTEDIPTTTLSMSAGGYHLRSRGRFSSPALEIISSRSVKKRERRSDIAKMRQEAKEEDNVKLENVRILTPFKPVSKRQVTSSIINEAIMEDKDEENGVNSEENEEPVSTMVENKLNSRRKSLNKKRRSVEKKDLCEETHISEPCSSTDTDLSSFKDKTEAIKEGKDRKRKSSKPRRRSLDLVEEELIADTLDPHFQSSSAMSSLSNETNEVELDTDNQSEDVVCSTVCQENEIQHNEDQKYDSDSDDEPESFSLSVAKQQAIGQLNDEQLQVQRSQEELKQRRRLKHELFLVQKEMKHKQEKTKFSEADLKAFLKNMAERKEKEEENNRRKRRIEKLRKKAERKNLAKKIKNKRKGVEIVKMRSSAQSVAAGTDLARQFLQDRLYSNNRCKRAPALTVYARKYRHTPALNFKQL